MKLSTKTAGYSTGAVQMATLPMPPHTISMPTPASVDLLLCRLEAPGWLSGGNADESLVPLISAPSGVGSLGNKLLQPIVPDLGH